MQSASCFLACGLFLNYFLSFFFSTDLYLQGCKIVAKEEDFKTFFFFAKIYCVIKMLEILNGDLCNECLNLNFCWALYCFC